MVLKAAAPGGFARRWFTASGLALGAYCVTVSVPVMPASLWPGTLQ